MHAHLTYDGTTLTLTLTDTVTNASFTMSQAIDIPSAVHAVAFVLCSIGQQLPHPPGSEAGMLLNRVCARTTKSMQNLLVEA